MSLSDLQCWSCSLCTRKSMPTLKLWHVTTNLGRESLLFLSTQPTANLFVFFTVLSCSSLDWVSSNARYICTGYWWCSHWNFKRSTRTISYYLWTDLSWEKNLLLSAFCEQLGLWVPYIACVLVSMCNISFTLLYVKWTWCQLVGAMSGRTLTNRVNMLTLTPLLR